MCNLSKGVREKGRAEGVVDGILSSIKNLVKNMGVSVEQAMSVLEIPEAERKNIWIYWNSSNLEKRHMIPMGYLCL